MHTHNGLPPLNMYAIYVTTHGWRVTLLTKQVVVEKQSISDRHYSHSKGLQIQLCWSDIQLRIIMSNLINDGNDYNFINRVSCQVTVVMGTIVSSGPSVKERAASALTVPMVLTGRHYKLPQHLRHKSLQWRCGRVSTGVLCHPFHAPPQTSVAHGHHFSNSQHPPTL
jgi:hypothetical protein